MNDYEDVTRCGLTDARRDALLQAQNECTFIWANSEGWPVGVTMSYVYRRGRLWLTASAQRKRISAVRRRPRVSICISSAGTNMGPNKSVTFKGLCAIHDDRDTKDWFYPALAEALFPSRQTHQRDFIRLLDSPRRVVLEVTALHQIGYDGDLMARATAQALGVPQGPADGSA